jgi:hypothetical protein
MTSAATLEARPSTALLQRLGGQRVAQREHLTPGEPGAVDPRAVIDLQPQQQRRRGRHRPREPVQHRMRGGTGGRGPKRRNAASCIAATIAAVGGSAVIRRSVSRTEPIRVRDRGAQLEALADHQLGRRPPMSSTRSGPPSGVSRATER